MVLREVVTEVLNSRKYGGVLYLLFNYKNLQSIQEKICPPLKQNVPPPYEKSEPNKRSNEILNIYDVEKINKALSTNYTLNHCTQVLLQIKQRYPNLIFSCKGGLIQYLKKTLQTPSCKQTTKITNSDLNQHAALLLKSTAPDQNVLNGLFSFNCQMQSLLKNLLPDSYLAISNSCLLTTENDSFIVKFLCKKSLILPYEGLLKELACKILANTKVHFKYLEKASSFEELFAILKLKLYFIHGLETYISWFNHLNFGSIKGEECNLFVSTKFVRDWMEDNSGDTILSCIQSVNQAVKTLKISVQPLQTNS